MLSSQRQVLILLTYLSVNDGACFAESDLVTVVSILGIFDGTC